jgi:hypothetical protein
MSCSESPYSDLSELKLSVIAMWAFFDIEILVLISIL